ncbi:MAG: AAA family ATPase, partial [Candidatus Omnitrophota bacterium]
IELYSENTGQIEAVERIVCTPDSTRGQFIGSFMPIEEEHRRFSKERVRFVKGVLYNLIDRASRPENAGKQYVLRLDQIEGLSPKVWVELNQFLLTGELYVPETGEVIRLPRNLKIIASLTSGLKDKAFYDRFLRRQLGVPEKDEIMDFIAGKFGFHQIWAEWLAENNEKYKGHISLGQWMLFASYVKGRLDDNGINYTTADASRIFNQELLIFLDNLKVGQGKIRMRENELFVYKPELDYDTNTRRLLIDGVELPVNDAAKAAIEKAIQSAPPGADRTALIKSAVKKYAKLIMTDDVLRALSAIARNMRYGTGVLRLEGPTGVGKTYIAEKLAFLIGLPFYGEPFHGASDQSKLLGSFKPNAKGDYYLDDNTPFLRLFKDGGVVALSELNAAVRNDTARLGWLFTPIARGDKTFLLNQYPRLMSGGEISPSVTRNPNSMIIIDINPADGYEARAELPEMLKSYTPEVWIEGKFTRDELKDIARDFLDGVPDPDARDLYAEKLTDVHYAIQEELMKGNEGAFAGEQNHVLSLRELRNAAMAITREWPEVERKIAADMARGIPREKSVRFIADLDMRQETIRIFYTLSFRTQEGQDFVEAVVGWLGSRPRSGDDTPRYIESLLMDTTHPVLYSCPAAENPFNTLNAIKQKRPEVEIVKLNTNLFTDDLTLYGGYVPDAEAETEAGERVFKWEDRILPDLITAAENDPQKIFVLAFENFHYLRPKIAVSLNTILQERVYYHPIRGRMDIPPNLRFFATASNESEFQISPAEQSRWVRLCHVSRGDPAAVPPTDTFTYGDVKKIREEYMKGIGRAPQPYHPAPADEGELLVPTKDLVMVESQIVRGMLEKKIAILEGDPGGGKTDISIDIADRLGLRSHVYSAHARAHLEDFIGTYAQDEHGRFVLTAKEDDGRFRVPFLDFYKNGGVFIIDEGAIGRRSQALISWLTGIARGETELVLYEHSGRAGAVRINRNKNFHIIITTNPVDETPGRESLPVEVIKNSRRIFVPNKFDDDTYKAIIGRFYRQFGGNVWDRFSDDVRERLLERHIGAHRAMIDFVNERAMLENPERHLFTLRDMKSWVKV